MTYPIEGEDLAYFEDPGEPRPWGEPKDPYQLIRKDVAALVRAKIITPAEARKALGLPTQPEPTKPTPPPAIRYRPGSMEFRAWLERHGV